MLLYRALLAIYAFKGKIFAESVFDQPIAVIVKDAFHSLICFSCKPVLMLGQLVRMLYAITTEMKEYERFLPVDPIDPVLDAQRPLVEVPRRDVVPLVTEQRDPLEENGRQIDIELIDELAVRRAAETGRERSILPPPH